jgi:hypothetical protein
MRSIAGERAKVQPDIDTEPADVDVHTLRNLGPLSGLVVVRFDLAGLDDAAKIMARTTN